MDYPIIVLKKYKKSDIDKIQNHDQLEKDIYVIHEEDIDYLKVIDSRILTLNLKRKVREDAIVLCQMFISCSEDFFKNLNVNDINNFFISACNFLINRFDKSNFISATIHYHDTPHMHFNFVPVAPDGRLCAKDLFKKSDLFKLHEDFLKSNISNGYLLSKDKNSASKDELKNNFKNYIDRSNFDFDNMITYQKTFRDENYILIKKEDYKKIKFEIDSFYKLKTILKDI